MTSRAKGLDGFPDKAGILWANYVYDEHRARGHLSSLFLFTNARPAQATVIG